jgi:uncharacterized membrane protein
VKLYVFSYIATAIVFLAIDGAWLAVMAAKLYRPILGDIMLKQLRPVPAILFYLIYLFGILVFAIHPAIESGVWWVAAERGAMLGFFCYATYDLTNQATLKNWSPLITIVDLGWGTMVTAAVSAIGYSIAATIA